MLLYSKKGFVVVYVSKYIVVNVLSDNAKWRKIEIRFTVVSGANLINP